MPLSSPSIIHLEWKAEKGKKQTQKRREKSEGKTKQNQDRAQKKERQKQTNENDMQAQDQPEQEPTWADDYKGDDGEYDEIMILGKVQVCDDFFYFFKFWVAVSTL